MVSTGAGALENAAITCSSMLALREGLPAICFRGSPGLLAKLQQIAAGTGARVETRHPSVTDEPSVTD